MTPIRKLEWADMFEMRKMITGLENLIGFSLWERMWRFRGRLSRLRDTTNDNTINAWNNAWRKKSQA